jgi:hypothetical protein
MKKLLLLIAALTLTACSSLDHFVCYGAGTCDRNGEYATGTYSGSSSYIPPAANGQVITTNSGNYVIVRSQTSGRVMSVIKSGK